MLTIFTISEYADSTITPRFVETYSTSSFNVALLISLLFKSETESMKSNSMQHCCNFWQNSSCCSFEVASINKKKEIRIINLLRSYFYMLINFIEANHIHKTQKSSEKFTHLVASCVTETGIYIGLLLTIHNQS